MAEQTSSQGLSKGKLIVAGAIGLCFIVLFLAFWFGAVGGGEYKDSPNAKHTAHLTLYTKRTLMNGKIQYVYIEVEEKGTGEIVWEMTYYPPPGSNPHIYGDRSQEFIRWESDSSAVHFPMDANGLEITVPIP